MAGYQQASFQVEFNGVRILATILQFERFRVDVFSSVEGRFTD